MKQTTPKQTVRTRLLPLLLVLLLLVPLVSSAAGSTAPSDIRVNLRRLYLTDQAWLPRSRSSCSAAGWFCFTTGCPCPRERR